MRVCVLWLLVLTFAVCAFAQGGALPAAVYNTPGPHVVVNGVLLQAPVKRDAPEHTIKHDAAISIDRGGGRAKFVT